MADTSVYSETSYDKAKRERSFTPKEWKGHTRSHKLRSFRLIEGHYGCMRLTMRGRAALKYHGRDCPDAFESHCPEIFDPVDLLPIVTALDSAEHLFTKGNRQRDRPTRGESLPDERDTWEAMLVEYWETEYHGRHSLTQASASLGRVQSTGTWLNGSLRQHSSFIRLEFQNAEGSRILECDLSVEQFTDLLTSNGAVPVTLDYYIGRDGMARGEPAAPAVSPMRRMRERMANSDREFMDIVDELRSKISDLVAKKRLSKKVADELDMKLKILFGRDGAFAVEQAVEELSAAAESLFTISSERLALSGGDQQVIEAQVLPLLSTGDEEVSE